MVLVHDANRSKLLMNSKLKWIRFLIFSILRILPLRFRTAENTSNFRRNTDKYGRLATLSEYVRCEERSGRSGRGNVHVKKNRGLAFQSRTGDRSEALLSGLHEVSHQKTSECVGLFFFLGRLSRLTNTLKFSVEFNKKKKKSKTTEACGRELILCQALRRPSVCAFRTGVLRAIESLFSKFSDWPNLPGRPKCGRW